MTRLALTLVLCCLAPLSWAQPSLRTQAVLLTANALVYYNPDPQAQPDERHLARMQQAGTSMREQLAVQPWPEPLRQAVDELLARQAQLASVPRQQAPRYPQLLVGLLDARLKLEAQLRQQVPAAEQSQQVQQRLSQAIGELLINAMARHARVLGAHSLNLDQDGFNALDRQIETDFTVLVDLLPAQAEVLHKQHRVYRFARQRLLEAASGQADGSLERYIGGVLLSLDNLLDDPLSNPLS
ncbi:conserved exported hypothetical protein [Pseudomonas sp. 8Z]|uniref:hypothetical protein n=1 Tax=Pseudomonas sp. 8Z TaxID=2653166 RepID=UPI0012EFAEAF|nr:hypothetical protein [Pseudomonas sp. 8Z]VXC51467.1 conserved exported hypothetical protein [Pseudomonas sp. 8Z]